MATPCGHSFCGVCVDTLQQTAHILCALCKRPIAQFCPNFMANEMLCIVDSECTACSTKLKLSSATDHFKQCPEVTVKCEACGEVCKRAEETAHSQNCLLIELICECGQKYKRMDETSHRDSTCLNKEVACPLKGDLLIKR